MYNVVVEFKDLMKEFRKLTSKVQQDNSTINKKLKYRDVMLQACQKEYQKVYQEREALKEKCNTLLQRILELEQQQQKQQNIQRQQVQARLNRHPLRQTFYPKKKAKKRYFITDDDNENEVEENDSDEDERDESENDDGVEYMKIKKTQENSC